MKAKLYIRDQKTLSFPAKRDLAIPKIIVRDRARMKNGRFLRFAQDFQKTLRPSQSAVFRSKRPRALARGASFFSFILFFSCSAAAFAEKIYLKSGEVLEGKILEANEEYINIDIYGVTQPYWLDEVERIEGESGKKIELIAPAQEEGMQKPPIQAAPQPRGQSAYADKKFKIEFKPPGNWQVLSAENNSGLFEWLKGRMAATEDVAVICFLVEDINAVKSVQEFGYNPLPLVTIAQKVIALENKEALVSARSAMAGMIESQKEKIKESAGKDIAPEMKFALLENRRKEQVIRFPKVEEIGPEGKKKKVLYTTYIYPHISKGENRVFTYIIMCGSWLDEGQKYIPAFDELAKSTVSLQ